jgi:hypothetical protein
MKRTLWIVGLMMVMMLAAVSAVGAQEQTAPQTGGNEKGGPMAQILRRQVMWLASEETGVPVRDLIAEIRSGKSLGTVLTEHGVDSAAFVDTVAAQLQERLDRAVSMGRLTQEQADERLSQFRERLTERLTVVPPVGV